MTGEILKVLRKDGWYITNQEGSHISLKHPAKSGKITVANHGGDLKPGTLNSIYKQAGLKQPGSENHNACGSHRKERYLCRI